jgi:hypothetical protein
MTSPIVYSGIRVKNIKQLKGIPQQGNNHTICAFYSLLFIEQMLKDNVSKSNAVVDERHFSNKI